MSGQSISGLTNVQADSAPATPSTGASDTRAGAAAKVSIQLGPCRILIVEDSLVVAKLTEAFLHKAGATVEHAENGKLGLDLALSRVGTDAAFDLIVMDMAMPVMDGYEATRRLREADFKRPIVALTAHAMAGDREKCLSAGCDEYDTKPVNRERFLSIVKAQLESGRRDPL